MIVRVASRLLPQPTVAEQLARSPPTKAIQAVCRRVFAGDLSFPPPPPPAFSFRRCSTPTSITPNGSHDLAAKSRLNPFTHSHHGPTVAERLDCSPPTQGESGSILDRYNPDFRTRQSCRTMPLVGGFSRGSPVSHAPSFDAAECSPHFARIASQDLTVKSRPNLFNYSLFQAQCLIEGIIHRIAASKICLAHIIKHRSVI
ncbi:hypothetical protein PR048_011588 [Dryococelus australis]|uniref:Uncharacterized protein n=1 Tax=Dryococelus australis TaxID=614101 RepID=A0ABQ9HLZ4_9NEOP|nr:hypothetical protein PR048_011588 [Dryococelus australis]